MVRGFRFLVNLFVANEERGVKHDELTIFGNRNGVEVEPTDRVAVLVNDAREGIDQTGQGLHVYWSASTCSAQERCTLKVVDHSSRSVGTEGESPHGHVAENFGPDSSETQKDDVTERVILVNSRYEFEIKI
jgi:hypothetical protein